MRNIIRITQYTVCIIILASSVFAQDSTRTDSLLANQKIIIGNQELMMGEVIYDDPLAGKKYGIELNPVGFLMSTAAEEGFSLTGGVSLFSKSEVAEIAFPFYYAEGERDYAQYTVDCHYRYFLGKHRKGFYVSSGLRFTHIEGQEGYSYFDWDDSPEDQIISDDKLGLTFGIGYRKYGYNGWYWGMSLFGGRYFTDKELNIYGGGISDGKVILDMELLKIGKMF